MNPTVPRPPYGTETNGTNWDEWDESALARNDLAIRLDLYDHEGWGRFPSRDALDALTSAQASTNASVRSPRKFKKKQDFWRKAANGPLLYS
jgi:hypothetical protein